MADTLKEFKLPKKIVREIIRNSLPESVRVEEDAVVAARTAASMFILHVTMLSQDLTNGANKKTIHPQQVFEALEAAGFESIVPSLKTDLEAFKRGATGEDATDESGKNAE